MSHALFTPGKIAAWTAFLLVLPVYAQQPARSVDLEVRVTEDGGKPAAGLQKNDFVVKESGKSQQISRFEFVPAEASGPRMTWIYVGVQVEPQDFPRVRDGIRKFISEKLGPRVMISLGGARFTNDKGELLKLLESGPPPDADLISLWSLDSRVELQGRVALSRYLTLIRQLSLMPGKKAVVLFRKELSIAQERYTPRTPLERGELRGGMGAYQQDSDPAKNQLFLDRLGSEALLARTAFYAVDSSGVESIAREELGGLYELAGRTGGRMVFSNDVSEAFGTVLGDFTGYYLLGYEPQDSRAKGRYRRISVSVARKGTKVAALPGYFEPEPFEDMGKALKALHLQQAFHFSGPSTGFPVHVSFDVFRGPDSKPLLVYSAGTRPKNLAMRSEGKGVAAEFVIAAQLTGAKKRAVTAYDEQTSRQVYARDAIERASKDENAMAEFTSKVAAEPGTQELKIVVRDERTGKIGGHRTMIEVPDLTRANAASTLLLTRRSAKPDAAATPLGALLDIGPYRFVPECSRTYHAGDPLFLLYDLYNVSDEILSAPPPLQIAIERGKDPVNNLAGAGQGVPIPASKTIRYAGAVNTAGLAPGGYTLFVKLPGGEDLRADFEILPAVPR